MTQEFILGTAGHIDHGKTSLIKALTGIDTDRLPEERRRGITIELGFAHLEVGPYRLGIVDVPGHERFVRHMLAGATGMDLALLVVAADDSVKQQTREHLDVLQLLDIPAGVIALTKCDLAEPEWIDLVEQEVRELVAGTFLANSPIVRTSSQTGAGLDELRDCLVRAADLAAQSGRANRARGPFRMAVDRVFTVAGHGTVVTGSISNGSVQLGDRLVLQPGGIEVRVRGLQNHDKSVERLERGQRAAINLANVHHDQILRGQELSSPGYLTPSRTMLAQLQLLQHVPNPLKRRTRVRFHVGTTEIIATVQLLDRELLEPGERGLVQLLLRDSAVTSWNQPFVLRSESPVQTIGGGRILVPRLDRLRRLDDLTLANLQQLGSSDPLARAAAGAFFLGTAPWQPQDLVLTAGIEDVESIYDQLVELGRVVEFPLSGHRTLRVQHERLQRLEDTALGILQRMHQTDPLRLAWERAQVIQRLARRVDAALADAIVRRLEQAGRIASSARGIGLPGYGPRLSKNEERLLSQLVELHRQAGLQPPSIRDCQQQVTTGREAVPKLLSLAASQGELVPICSEFYLHHDVFAQLRQTLREELAKHPSGLTVSQIREILDTTRKYAVPICEFLDAEGFTVRDGDRRFLASERAAAQPTES